MTPNSGNTPAIARCWNSDDSVKNALSKYPGRVQAKYVKGFTRTYPPCTGSYVIRYNFSSQRNDIMPVSFNSCLIVFPRPLYAFRAFGESDTPRTRRDQTDHPTRRGWSHHQRESTDHDVPTFPSSGYEERGHTRG